MQPEPELELEPEPEPEAEPEASKLRQDEVAGLAVGIRGMVRWGSRNVYGRSADMLLAVL